MNRSPFLARFHRMGGTSLPLAAWSNCYAIADFTFGSPPGPRSWFDYAWAAGYLPHGPVHTMIGGYGAPREGLEEFRRILGDDVALGAFANGLLYVPKDMFRDVASVEFPAYCAFDAPQEACHVICPRPDDFDASGFRAEMDAFMAGYDWYAALDDDRTRAFLALLCETPLYPGDMLEAGAPNDVSFWPIHPFMDRLLQYKRIADPFSDAAWKNGTADYTRLCVRDAETDCKGHHAHDLTAFTTTVLDAHTDRPAVRGLTNGEVFLAANPHDYKLDYVYDHFDHAHCDALGDNETAFPHFPRLDWWDADARPPEGEGPTAS